MNAAAQEASAQQLLFLHADSTLPHEHLLQNAFLMATTFMEQHPRAAGHFPLKFIHPPPNQPRLFHFMEQKTRLNRAECIHGDQGIWISKDFFQEICGFDTTYPFLEERQLALAVQQKGRWFTLPGHLETSARRFHREGTGRRMLLNAMIMGCHQMEFHEFFQAAPALYRQQDRTSLLKISYFFNMIEQINRETCWSVSAKRWKRAGHTLRHATWQFFFLLDIATVRRVAPHRHPFLTLYTQWLHPMTRFLPLDWAAALIVWVWFHGSRIYWNWKESAP